ncbi:hypothetical protein AMELA_G00119080 [Ameiurus melas]|uniref:Uncharacterized protein n=1 Tax=Ameiurus melas TaxID=219545 RepID=A0A7J6AM45_AMEME|nr:hypothetical protein AMELA_G00119080 [Ameiurus melas]
MVPLRQFFFCPNFVLPLRVTVDPEFIPGTLGGSQRTCGKLVKWKLGEHLKLRTDGPSLLWTRWYHEGVWTPMAGDITIETSNVHSTWLLPQEGTPNSYSDTESLLDPYYTDRSTIKEWT